MENLTLVEKFFDKEKAQIKQQFTYINDIEQ